VVLDLKLDNVRPWISTCAIPGENLQNTDRFEVDLRYGKFILRQTDLFVVDDLPIVLTRTYNSREWTHPNPVHAFGRNANHRYDIAPLGTRNPYTHQVILFEDGESLYFPRISAGVSYGDAAYRHSESSGSYYGATQRWEGTGWRLTRADGYTVRFPDSYSATNTAQGGPYEIFDPKGRLTLKRNETGDLQEIRTKHGHFIRFQYDDQHRIVSAETDSGDRREYRYNFYGMLTDVATPKGVDRHYEYKGNLMTVVTDRSGNVLLRNEYDGDVLVGQWLLNWGSVRYEYGSGHSYFEWARLKSPGGKPFTVDTAASVPLSAKREYK
jgi:YD repeat-containing protein